MISPLAKFMPVSKAPPDMRAHAFERVSRAIGFVAIALPLVWLIAGVIRFIPPNDLQNSISHFYYIPFLGDFFVGCLIFNGILLLFMFHTNGVPVPGWQNLSSRESLMMRFAGVSSIMIALFPTGGPSDSYKKSELIRVFTQFTKDPLQAGEPIAKSTPEFDFQSLHWLLDLYWHQVFAGVMFAILAYFTYCVFTRVHMDSSRLEGDELTPQKLKRNRYYRFFGIVIAFCIVGLVIGVFGLVIPLDTWDHYNATFALEAFALLAFGFAWLIKGRYFTSLND